jgi:tetratricopeptide (TPR) repeat protein
LTKAEILTERHPIIRAVTLNNLGCYYRKKGQLRTALNYVDKALSIEEKQKIFVKTADTHLNMCSILSDLRRHEQAYYHCSIALKMLILELFGNSNPDSDASYLLNQNANNNNDLPRDRIAVLAIAYHNMAVQEECLRRFEASVVSYQKAIQIVDKHLGADHPLLASLTDAYMQAQSKLKYKLHKSQEIQAKRNLSPMKALSRSSSEQKSKIRQISDAELEQMLMQYNVSNQNSHTDSSTKNQEQST